MATFPLILAGPIVRRITPELVSIWVALSEPRAIKLSVFTGPKQAEVLAVAPDADPAVPQQDFSGKPQRTRRVGDNLHVAVVTVTPPLALLPGQLYSYNLSFGPHQGNFVVEDDLRSQHLLEDADVLPDTTSPHKALGYGKNTLPAFATCPPEITDLKLIHGSCRRVNADLEDALAWVDDIIEGVRESAIERPHQLMLSGDQIYADDVPVVLLPQLQQRGIELLGATEFVPMMWREGVADPPTPTQRPVDAEHLPAGMRHHLIDSEARMTSNDNHSHLIAFGEFCAMYLFVWSPVLWDVDALTDFDDIFSGFAPGGQLPDNWGSLFIKTTPDADDQLVEADIRPVLDLLVGFDDDRRRLFLKNEKRASKNFRKREGLRTDLMHPAGLILEKHITANLPAKARAILAKDDATDAELARADEMLFAALADVTADEVQAVMKTVVDPRAFITRFPTPPDPLTSRVLAVCRALANQTQFRAVFELGRELAFPKNAAGEFDFTKLNDEKLWRFCQVLTQLTGDYGGLYKKTLSEDHRKQQVEKFHARLPHVRRAMANVSTYMIFDDHEVTDDWNLNPIWIDRVYNAPLGRTILRNGLAAYGVFQGWGNDPAGFAEGDHRKMLDLVTKLVPQGQTQPPTDLTKMEELETLFGLRGEVPKIDWHFSVTGSRHQVFALDNRTRREFKVRIGPPGNVGSESMKKQFPTGPRPPGIEVVFVVAPLTVMGPSLIDDLIAPLSYRVFDMLDQSEIDGMPGTNPDAVEAWVFSPELLEQLLKHAASWGRVVFLSGDVHHAASQQMSYWKKGATEPARFAQFTSSGMRNVMPSYLRTLSSSFGFMQQLARADIDVTRFGWNNDNPDVLNLPAGTRLAPTVRPKLAESPVLLPKHGVPAGARFARAPDWQWHMDVVIDQRPDGLRPTSAQITPLGAADEFEADANGSFDEAYQRLAAKHAQQIDQVNHGRQIMFANNLGMVRFEEENANDPARAVLVAVHELHATHPEAVDPQKPEIHARHVVPLRVPDATRPGAEFV